MYDNAISQLYEHAVSNHTFYIVHWAAANNRKDILKLALSCGADINEPFKSVSYFNDGQNGYSVAPEKYEPDSALDELIEGRLDLFYREQWRFDQQWYRGDDCSEVPTRSVKRLFRYYNGEKVGEHAAQNDPLLAAAHTPEVKRVFLGLFCFWTTPLHLAIAEDHGDMIDELMKHGADVNATSYGNCDCHLSDKVSAKNATAYSPIHLLDCQGFLDKGHKALLQGKHCPDYLCMDRSMIAPDSQLVKPCKAVVQPHNILHQVLLSIPSMERSAWYIRALINAAGGQILNERNNRGKRPVEVAMEKGFDMEIVHMLLAGREDLIVQAQTDGPHGHEACSVLAWAILAGHIQYANYLLPGNPSRKTVVSSPANAAVVTESGFSVLHAICAQASEEVQGVSFKAAQDRSFPCNTTYVWQEWQENHRMILLQNILKTPAAQQVNLFSAEERTPLTEAFAWAAAEPFNEIEGYIHVLLQHGANPFAGIDKGIESPIEVFLKLLVHSPKYKILPAKTNDDIDRVDKFLELLRGINFRAFQPQAYGVPDHVFQQLERATDFLWVPEILGALSRLRG
ncbi:unnamed protein product [Discula destructiva]